MDYESLLESAYEKVTPVKACERFGVIGVKGHHEGNKTIITNFSQLSVCIRRPAPHLMKFLFKELASGGEMSGERLIFARKLSSKEVNEKIQKYVNRYVLCSKCKKPDTELADESGKLILRCMACGNKAEVNHI